MGGREKRPVQLAFTRPRQRVTRPFQPLGILSQKGRRGDFIGGFPVERLGDLRDEHLENIRLLALTAG